MSISFNHCNLGLRRLLGLFSAALLLGAAPSLAQNDQDLLGEPRLYLTSGPETLKQVAARHSVDLGELRRANPYVSSGALPGGTLLSLPSGHLLPNVPREGIVINLAESRLYAFGSGPSDTLSFPLVIDHRSCGVAIGHTSVAGLRVRPWWTVPAAWHEVDPDLPKIIAPGSANPLGALAIDLQWQDYIIHEASGPRGEGIEKGCFGLAYADIALLFGRVGAGTPVNVIDQPIKLGWSGGALYIEAHPASAERGHSGPLAPHTAINSKVLEMAVRRQAWGREDDLDWHRILEAARERNGVPVRITRR